MLSLEKKLKIKRAKNGVTKTASLTQSLLFQTHSKIGTATPLGKTYSFGRTPTSTPKKATM
jgi:hypothetical protein